MTETGIAAVEAEEFDAHAVVDLAAALVRFRTVNDGGSRTVEEPAVALVAVPVRSHGP